MSKVKLTKTLKMDGKEFPRGTIVDLPKEQAESYLARHLAVKPDADLPGEDPVTTDVTTQPSHSEGDGPPKDKEGNELPPWTLKKTPIQYVDAFKHDAPNSDLANQYIDAGHGNFKATAG